MHRPAIGKSGLQARSLPWPKPGHIAVAYFLLFFLYVWFRIEPAVEYQHSSPVFLLTRPFLDPFLEYPGGLLDYTAAGLSQMNYYNWLGALVYTSLGGLLWLGSQQVLSRVTGADSRTASFGIAFLLLLLRERFHWPVLAMSTGLLAVLALALGYFRLFKNPRPTPSTPEPDPKESVPLPLVGQASRLPSGCPALAADRPLRASETPAPLPEQLSEGSSKGSSFFRRAGSAAWSRLCVCWILSSLLFYVAGAWPCALFLVLIGLFPGLRGHRRWLGLACALPVLVTACWLICFDDLDPVKLLNPWCKGAEGWLLGGALYLFLPLACAELAFRRPAVSGPAAEARRGARRPAPRRHWYDSITAKRAVAGGLFVFGWGLVWFCLAAPQKWIAEMDYYSSRGDYGRVLAVARAVPREQMDFASEARLHLALYHTGRLGQDVFSYRNQSGWNLLPGLGGGLESCRAQSVTLLELGLVGDAEHLAHEALENEGARPELLRVLAHVNVLKDRPQAARVFLNVLGQIPFQSGWAKTWLRNLERNPRLTGISELDAIRPLMPTNDLAHEAFPAEGLLAQLLRCNSTNQMAFEYLMTEFLMNSEVNKLVDRLGQLDSFKYTNIPRHYEEAVLLCQQMRGTPVELRGRSIRPETIERFRRFTEAMSQRVVETEGGRQAFARDFGDTFWYYYFARRGASKPS